MTRVANYILAVSVPFVALSVLSAVLMLGFLLDVLHLPFLSHL